MSGCGGQARQTRRSLIAVRTTRYRLRICLGRVKLWDHGGAEDPVSHQEPESQRNNPTNLQALSRTRYYPAIYSIQLKNLVPHRQTGNPTLEYYTEVNTLSHTRPSPLVPPTPRQCLSQYNPLHGRNSLDMVNNHALVLLTLLKVDGEPVIVRGARAQLVAPLPELVAGDALGVAGSGLPRGSVAAVVLGLAV